MGYHDDNGDKFDVRKFTLIDYIFVSCATLVVGMFVYYA